MPNIVLPAEWEEQSAVQLTWPHQATDWAPYYKEACSCFGAIAKAIARYQKVVIVCRVSSEIEEFINGINRDNLILFNADSNDTWARDHGAITIFKDGKPEIIDFQFNGWGLKFASDKDNVITSKMYEAKIFSPDTLYNNQLHFAFEGGSIESDGKGTILTTSECLLSLNRNGITDKSEIETYLIKTLGTNRVLWLDYGYLAGDDTDSHIDTLARLCPGDTILYVECTDKEDEHYEQLYQMKLQLETFKTSEGKLYKLIALPMAKAAYDDGDRLPATYANFLIINGAVLMPTYGTELDKVAHDVLQTAFPDREIIDIDCRVLIRQHGSLHCVTMQYPEGVIK